jgi:serine/threonine protein kinase
LVNPQFAFILVSGDWEAATHMRPCGNGSHAVVFRAGRTAIKRFRPGAQSASPRAQAEFELALTFATHNLVRVLAANVVEGWLEMEFVDGGSLAELVEREGALSERRIVRAVGDMLAGLSVMHAHGLVHRDVKPANVMLDSASGACKLIDWIGGEEEELSLSRHGKPVGTPLFMAPEVAGRPHRHVEQSDSWALGCTVLNLASGRLPWEDADARGRTNGFMAMWKSAHGVAPPHDPAEWSPALAAFVARCFEADPSRRARARELRGDGLFRDFIQ